MSWKVVDYGIKYWIAADCDGVLVDIERKFMNRARLIAAAPLMYESLKECADDLEAEIRHRYGYPDIHPTMMKRYRQDMESVYKARSIIRTAAKDE